MADPLSLLGDDDPDDYPEDSFRVNKEFSSSYDVWRQKEEMAKLKHMSDSSSESESEEEPIIEKDFLNALSILKSDDPRIYRKDFELFKDSEVTKKPKVKKEKPMFMKDLERELILKTNGEFSEDEEDQRPGMTLAEEQEQQRKAFGVDSEDDEDDDIMREHSKVKSEEDAKEADYLRWLKGEKEDVNDDVKDMKFLHQYWNNPNLDKDEKFLRDYILNEKFRVKDESELYLTNDNDNTVVDVATLSEDEEMAQRQEQFEHKYNFRFEEPDPEFIKRYPRTIGDSLRREDNKRKNKREEYMERKKKEKEQYRDELKRLKALKRKEIEEKFLKLKEISGQEELNFDEEDIESDFDPEKHDRKMKELFNDDYYSVEEQQKPEFEYDEELDDEKWDLWTRETEGNKGTSQGDDDEEEEESDYESSQRTNAKDEFEQEMIDSSRVGRKRGKKKSLFAKIISQPKPIYDPQGKSFDDYLDEYYKMDFEDVVGDLPVRFKYRKVVPNDFGLSVDEILAAHDKELNRWCSVKKTCQYRQEDEEKYDIQAFQKKAQNTDVKKKILSSVYSLPKEDDDAQNSEIKDDSKKVKRKKRRSKKKKNTDPSIEASAKKSTDITIDSKDDDGINILPSKKVGEPMESNGVDLKSKSKKRKKNAESFDEARANGSADIAVDGEDDDGINILSSKEVGEPQESSGVDLKRKSKKRKKKKKNAGPSGEACTKESTDIALNGEDDDGINILPPKEVGEHVESNEVDLKGKSKKRKRKKKSALVGSSNLLPLNDAIDDDNFDGMNIKKIKRENTCVEDVLKSNVSNKSKAALDQGIEEASGNANRPNKKSHKKKRKSKGGQDYSSKKQFNHNFHPQNFSSNAKLQNPEADKKLAIPNSRLASYGLNPKKFKNSIIYS